jgi:16S rRNA C967 or C1407 C5-methylase (RsmB/RsmF family)/NOL1/NOP2/fmu family ribosome biogenesis protein
MRLPQELINSLELLPGFESGPFLQAHATAKRITSIRQNPFKKTGLDFGTQRVVRWCHDAYYLDERPAFTLDPLFHAGCYYVQEAGSMFLEHALKSTLDFNEQLKVLDLCAAPGGKSTLINSLLSEESLLVSNEVVKQRSVVLGSNLSKWGTCNAVVTNNDPQRFAQLPSYFDAIVLDAPCSGSGLFRKQPEAIEEWSLDNVNLCSSRQKRIIADCLPALKAGGFLYYSTCSYSKEENEEIVRWMISEFDLEYIPLQVDKDWGIVETEGGYRFYPHLTDSEGFFIAVLRKKEADAGFVRSAKVKEPILAGHELNLLKEFVDPKGFIFHKNNNRFHLVNEALNHFINVVGKGFYLRKAGVAMGEVKGKDFVPDHELALYRGIKYERLLELNQEEALHYLRKEAFSADGAEKGLTLISYQKQGLGWAKILPGRVNNYLPSELRILK